MGKIFEPTFFIYQGKRYLVMSYYYYQEFKHGINQLLTNHGFTFNKDVTTIIDSENDFIEITQDIPFPEDSIEIRENSFYLH